MEPPAHALFECFDLSQRRARNHRQAHVSRRQVRHTAVEMIREVRATRAAFLPIRTEHEVVDDQLASAAEEIGKRLLAFWSIEDVGLLDLFPREFTALPAQLIAQPRKLLLLF